MDLKHSYLSYKPFVEKVLCRNCITNENHPFGRLYNIINTMHVNNVAMTTKLIPIFSSNQRICTLNKDLYRRIRF